ncbi:ACT domain-containing protein [Tanacetum coccineum]
MVTVDNNESIQKVTGNISKRYQIQKLEVYNEILQRLKEAGNEEAIKPGFDDDLLAHFNRLPNSFETAGRGPETDYLSPSYASRNKMARSSILGPASITFFKAMKFQSGSFQLRSVSMHYFIRKKRCIMHKRLLSLAHDHANGIAAFVVSTMPESNSDDLVNCSSPGKQIAQSIHPPPAFGSSTNLEALALEASGQRRQPESLISFHLRFRLHWPMHEITFSTDDKPKLLNQLTTLLDEVGLNIQEAHVFSTVDRYSLDVFVVDGWPCEETEQLRDALERKLSKLEISISVHKQSSSNQCSSSPGCNHLRIPNDGADVWEIDPQFLKLGHKVASGSYGDLYKGTYRSQEVAIKVLKAEKISSAMQQEFAQEVYIMRFVVPNSGSILYKLQSKLNK